MSAALLVLSPGLSTSVQDEGRLGLQRYGIPVSGALDRVALAAANVVVGNMPGIAGLECLYQGPTLEVVADSARIAVAGAGALIELIPAGARIDALESTRLSHGDRFRVVLGGPSISAYLAVEGGIAIPSVLGSRSTYVRAQLGGLAGRTLRPGDRLPLTGMAARAVDELRLPNVDLAPAKIVRVVLGPQADRFTTAALRTLETSSYQVQPASDRMGLRLSGEHLEHVSGADIVSDAIAPGAIQVPGNGQPIVMLADRQTTGGYTKIATVISADVPALGRVGPGASIRFRVVDVAEAEALRRALDEAIAGWSGTLRPIAADASEESLATANLVSGVIDAADED
jgi:biotin-dependent carboxylase-like uncharacterized protein